MIDRIELIEAKFKALEKTVTHAMENLSLTPWGVRDAVTNFSKVTSLSLDITRDVIAHLKSLRPRAGHYDD